ncbi:MAG TPA: helix-turn-helix domain-containing protein [Thermoanaerobacter sp.]|nr:helix-turn-helix domain-containing protein [Thermoanaerobacter sp.]
MCYPVTFINEIQKLYKQGLKQKEIAEKLNCSISTVKKAIKTDPEYKKIRQEKKEKNKEKYKQAKLNYIKQKREIEKQKQEEEERLWWGMIEQQRIHAQMISKRRKLSTAQAVEYSLSQYFYTNEKLVYINPHQKPADLPQTFDVHKNILPQFKEYMNKIESEKWNSKVEKEALK